MTIEYFKKLFDYDAWANERMLTAMEATPNLAEEAAKKMSHLLQAKTVWVSRLIPGNPAGNFHTVLTPAAARQLNSELKATLEKYFGSLREDQLSQKIAYQNLKGLPFETVLSDILAHLVNHGTYHRGQVATLIKRSGGEPPVTDYIAFVR
jgi:uncharacterized damage-inducible protein DinB